MDGFHGPDDNLIFRKPDHYSKRKNDKDKRRSDGKAKAIKSRQQKLNCPIQPQFTRSEEGPSNNSQYDTQTDLSDNGLWRRAQGDQDVDLVWKDKFYAAASFFFYTDAQRRWTQCQPNVEESKDTKGRLLDGLALLFARYKGDSEAQPQGASRKRTSKEQKEIKYGRGIKGQDAMTNESLESTSAHVAATAFGKLEFHEDQIKPYRFTIHIAKNNGPQSLDGMDDEIFMNKLGDWYNDIVRNEPGPDPPKPTADDEIWMGMQEFWVRRNRYYVREIRRTRERLASAGLPDPSNPDSEPNETFLAACCELNAHFGTTDAEAKKLIKQDWAHLGTLLKWMDDDKIKYNVGDDTCLNSFINRICIEGDEPWNLSYRKLKPLDESNSSSDQKPASDNNTQEDQACFRKLIKHFKMLRTLRSIWNAFYRLAKHEDFWQAEIRFVFLPKPAAIATPKIYAQALMPILNQWHSELGGIPIPGLINKSRQALATVVQSNIRDRLRSDLRTALNCIRSNSIAPKFHCELQLLNILPRWPEKDERQKHYGYFGCSKLSCFTCWCVLRSQGFSTKNTHGTLHHQVAFPLEGAPNPDAVTECLKGMAAYLEHAIINTDPEMFPQRASETSGLSQTPTFDPSWRIKTSTRSSTQVDNSVQAAMFGLSHSPIGSGMWADYNREEARLSDGMDSGLELVEFVASDWFNTLGVEGEGRPDSDLEDDLPFKRAIEYQFEE